jgi:hypothetical protein
MTMTLRDEVWDATLHITMKEGSFTQTELKEILNDEWWNDHPHDEDFEKEKRRLILDVLREMEELGWVDHQPTLEGKNRWEGGWKANAYLVSLDDEETH